MRHGVPSPGLWKDYIHILEQKNNAGAAHVSFRHKKPGWTRFSLKVDFDNKSSVLNSCYDDPYLRAFLTEISMRENCHTCKYTNTNRAGDITLADFWGYRSNDFKMRNTEEGHSLVLINNKRGEEAFEQIKPKIMWQQRTLKEAMGGNRSLYRPWAKNPKSDEFWAEYCGGVPLEELFTRYAGRYRLPLKMRLDWVLINHMYLIPKRLLLLRKALKKR